MKINLILNPNVNESRGGYTNISAHGGENQVQGNVFDLSGLVEDSVCEELVALEILDYAMPAQIAQILGGWLKKMRKNGLISLGGVDMGAVAKAFLNYQIDLNVANNLLYGLQRNPMEYRKSALSLPKMVELLESAGFKVEQKRLEGFNYYVTARRI